MAADKEYFCEDCNNSTDFLIHKDVTQLWSANCKGEQIDIVDEKERTWQVLCAECHGAAQRKQPKSAKCLHCYQGIVNHEDGKGWRHEYGNDQLRDHRASPSPFKDALNRLSF